MLVVIGIMGILMAVLLPSYFYVQQIARQSQAQRLVSNAATALTVYLQREKEWHKDILDSQGYFDWKVCKVLYEAGLLDVTMKTKDGKVLNNVDDTSVDKFGLLDPWGQALLRRSKEALEETDKGAVPDDDDPKLSLKKHLLQFRVDLDFDGKIDSRDDGPLGTIPLRNNNSSIRGSAMVWSRGPNGKDDDPKGRKYPHQNRLSWAFGE